MNKFLFTYNKKSREKELYISDKKINLKTHLTMKWVIPIVMMVNI